MRATSFDHAGQRTLAVSRLCSFCGYFLYPSPHNFRAPFWDLFPRPLLSLFMGIALPVRRCR